MQHLFNASSVGVKGFVLNSSNELLLVEHTYCDGWHFPGGGAKSGETPFEALKRELEEETGIEVLNQPDIFGIYYQDLQGINDYPILFIVKDFNAHPIKHPNLEIKQMGWFPLDQLPENTTPCTLQRIQEVFAHTPKSPRW